MMEPNPKHSAKPRILVVEDDALINDIIVDWLSDHGFRVESTVSAEHAVKLLADKQVDALFTDIQLAGEMDGIALAQRARDICPDLPVIYTSGQIRAPQPRVPHSMFFPKPYRPDHIGEVLTNLIACAAPDRKREVGGAGTC